MRMGSGRLLQTDGSLHQRAGHLLRPGLPLRVAAVSSRVRPLRCLGPSVLRWAASGILPTRRPPGLGAKARRGRFPHHRHRGLPRRHVLAPGEALRRRLRREKHSCGRGVVSDCDGGFLCDGSSPDIDAARFGCARPCSGELGGGFFHLFFLTAFGNSGALCDGSNDAGSYGDFLGGGFFGGFKGGPILGKIILLLGIRSSRPSSHHGLGVGSADGPI